MPFANEARKLLSLGGECGAEQADSGGSTIRTGAQNIELMVSPAHSSTRDEPRSLDSCSLQDILSVLSHVCAVSSSTERSSNCRSLDQKGNHFRVRNLWCHR